MVLLQQSWWEQAGGGRTQQHGSSGGGDGVASEDSTGYGFVDAEGYRLYYSCQDGACTSGIGGGARRGGRRSRTYVRLLHVMVRATGLRPSADSQRAACLPLLRSQTLLC